MKGRDLMGNLDLWNKVEVTKPSHTKKVNFGRAITAIDPYHQIKNATEQFGPVGKGWGYKVVEVHHLPTNELCVIIEMWHSGDPSKTFCHSGQASYYIDKEEKKKDKDCMKKAITDGLTKCLSILGFNADIFLGKFDDNKYYQEQVNKEAKENKVWHGPVQRSKFSDAVIQFNKELDKCETKEEFQITKNNNKAVWDQIKLDNPKDAKLKNPDCTSGETTGGHIQRLHQHFEQVEEMNNMENR